MSGKNFCRHCRIGKSEIDISAKVLPINENKNVNGY
jgi:hypothetical protein